MDLRGMLNLDPNAPNSVPNSTSTGPGGGPGQGGTNPPPVINQSPQHNSNPDQPSSSNTTEPTYNNPSIVIEINSSPENIDFVNLADLRRVWNEQNGIHFEHYPLVDGNGNITHYIQHTRNNFNGVLNIKTKVFGASGEFYETNHHNFDHNRARFLKSFRN